MAIDDEIEGESTEQDELATEGEIIVESEADESGEVADEGGSDDGEVEEEEGGEEESSLSSRLDDLAARLNEKDREIAFLRGQISHTTKPDTEAEPTLDIDEEELARQLTDKDPKVGVKAIRQLIDKVTNFNLEQERRRTQSTIRDTDQVRTLKEQDRGRVLSDFSDELNDQSFIDQMNEVFQANQRSNGGRYTANSLYAAASMVKVTRDRVAARARGTRNGVTEVRPTRDGTQTNTSSVADYTKIDKIDNLPSTRFSAREKAQMKASAKRMGVSEKEWISNLEADA